MVHLIISKSLDDLYNIPKNKSSKKKYDSLDRKSEKKCTNILKTETIKFLNKVNKKRNQNSKKIVRFADECGKTLTTYHLYEKPIYKNLIKTISFCSSIQNILPESNQSEEIKCTTIKQITIKSINMLTFNNFLFHFKMPSSSYAQFRNRVHLLQVSLENIYFNENIFVGTVKVVNIAYVKEVSIIYTVDNWETVSEQQAQYVHSSENYTNKNQMDTFSFKFAVEKPDTTKNERVFNLTQINIIHKDNIEAVLESRQYFSQNGKPFNSKNVTFHKNMSLKFAIRYRLPTKQVEYWDNNEGRNYTATGITYSCQ
ncbi:Protein phosphatase 1 regulatory subunit 3B-A [Intoshia linei]|uniref:Protein phosphatase 1 regulatory subunit 3B-A n=1 Tax=Intoshia linei TaxID=1819745 RepID=A0A177B138_9BILA|nr:Protein phosphatase 1 regulatory subunit 3B-A [Intoshia linei]